MHLDVAEPGKHETEFKIVIPFQGIVIYLSLLRQEFKLTCKLTEEKINRSTHKLVNSEKNLSNQIQN